MKVEFGEIVGNQQERLLAAISTLVLRGGQFGLHIATSLVEILGKAAFAVKA